MARPNVTIRIVDESLSSPFQEIAGPAVGAMVSRNGLVLKMGVTAEKEQGWLLAESVNDWYARLRTFTEKELIANGITGGTLQANIGASAAAYIAASNTTGALNPAWKGEWWAVHNFLQYGSVCYVGATGSVQNTVNPYTSLIPNEIDFDVMFMGTTGSTAENDVVTVIEAKTQTDFGAVGVLCDDSANPPSTAPSIGNSQYFIHTWGNKLHFDSSGNLITTNLSADVAGCLARTDRDFYPWFSPAGRTRGRILSVVRLEKNPTEAQQDVMYDAGYNPIVTFPGEGTVLFGDKTGDPNGDTSTLSRINVSRLFISLRKLLSPVARAILFEQNDEFTRERFKLTAETTLNTIKAQRGIEDFKVICDSSNNTPDLIQQRIFVADVLVKPITAINYVRLTFTNKNLNQPL
jgi:hypothetical protein